MSSLSLHALSIIIWFLEILDDIGTQIDRTDQRVRVETNRVGIVDRKDNTCGYWIVIIILFVSIVVVAAL